MKYIGSRTLCTLMSIASVSLAGGSAYAENAKLFGIAMRATPKYGPSKPFEFINPKAPKGGALVLGSYSSFDTLNPFVNKGIPAALLASVGYEDFVFETLLSRGNDEPFSKYSLIAEKMELAKDDLSATFYLNPKAKFSDGKPLTADDVVFTFNIHKSDKVRPEINSYYQDVKSCTALNKATVKCEFKQVNPELHMLLGELHVLPKHIYGVPGKDFATDFSKIAVGSGPYMVDKFEFGKHITYKRNPNYWGKDEVFNVGRSNFDTITFKYFRDANVYLEAFKAGEFDFYQVSSSKQWAKDLSGEKFDKNWIIKKLIYHTMNQGSQGFEMNYRRPLFKDLKVRKALALALDFDSMNNSLFFGQYTQAASNFANSELAATGLPSKEELKLLEPIKANLNPEVFTSPMGKPLGSGLDGRARLMAAAKLFEEAGWKVKDGVLQNANGEKFEFNILHVDQSWGRLTEPYFQSLAKIGVRAKLQIIDASLYEQKVNKFDFDVILGGRGQSESPGNEQRDFFGSKAADEEGSRNYAGIKNPGIDALIDHVIKANTRADLVIATHALDRALWFEYFLVPHWYIKSHRITWWNKLGMPKYFPKYEGSPTTFIAAYGWYDIGKAKALEQAKKDGKALPAP